MTGLKERIDLYLKLGENIKTDIFTYLSDTSIDIKDRWAMFERISDKGILGQDCSSDGFILVLDKNGTLYDDFYTDRYGTLFYTDMYEIIQENKEERGYEDSRILAWQEEVLKSGQDSFIYDW